MPEPEDDPSVVPAPDYEVVTKLPHNVLVDIAEEADCVLELVPAMGDFVPRGGPLFRAHVRLVERVVSWEGYVGLAFDELRLAGAGSPQVARRLRAALEDLRTVASPERRPALDRQLELLDEG